VVKIIKNNVPMKTIQITLLMVFTCSTMFGQRFEYGGAIQGTLRENANAVCIGQSGEIYITGFFEGKTDFNPSPAEADTFYLTSNGGRDIFVLKLSPDNEFLWARKIGGGGDDEGYDIETDLNDNIYIAGYFENTVDFNPGPGVSNRTSNGQHDIFILKLSGPNDLVYVKTLGGTLNDRSTSIVYNDDIDGLGLDTEVGLVAVGIFSDTIDIDPGPDTLYLTSQNTDVFMLSLKPNGEFRAASTIKSSGLMGNPKIANLDNLNSNFYILAMFTDTLKYTYGTYIDDKFPAYIVRDVYLDDTSFSHQGTTIIDGNEQIMVSDIMVFPFKSNYAVAITGAYTDSLLITEAYENFSNVSNGNLDAFLFVLSRAGLEVIRKDYFGGNGQEVGLALCYNAGHVYLSGSFTDSLNFTLSPDSIHQTIVPENSEKENFLIKYSVDTIVHKKMIRQYMAGRVYDMDINGDTLITVGNFSDYCDLNPGTGIYNLPFAGVYDAFIQGINLNAATKTASFDTTACGSFRIDDVVYDSSGSFQQKIIALNGEDSIITLNLIINEPSFHQVDTSACKFYWFNGNKLTVTGIYYDTLTNIAGCDSIIKMNLNIEIDNNITVDNSGEYPILFATDSADSYQWVRCDGTYDILDGKTTNSLTVTDSGSYAVIIAKNSCIDTTICKSIADYINFIPINLQQKISIYPNPTDGEITIEMDQICQDITLQVTDINGRIVQEKSIKGSTSIIQFNLDNNAGVYLLNLYTKDKSLIKYLILKE